MARPIPRPDPVTIADLPASLIVKNLLLYYFLDYFICRNGGYSKTLKFFF